MTSAGYCPQCGQQRVGSLRYCSRCRFDFGSIRIAASGTVTSLTKATPAANVRVAEPNPPPESSPTPPSAETEPSQPIQILAGVAWLIGAAAIGYLAFLQLEYSGLGFADSDDALGLALWNGATAAITAYFGAMAIVAPSRGRMAGAVLWALINVIWGGYQVSEGLTHGAFILALVAFSLAGVSAFVAWLQYRGKRVTEA